MPIVTEIDNHFKQGRLTMKRLSLIAGLAIFAVFFITCLTTFVYGCNTPGHTTASTPDQTLPVNPTPPALPTTNAAPEPGSEIKKEKINMKIHSSGTWKPNLNDAELNTLFAIASDTLDWCVNGSSGRFAFEQYNITAEHRKYSATFVTLKIANELRGCIGSLEAVEPLYLSVHRNAINAARHDPRFPAVEPGELPGIHIDVSILSSNKTIAAYSDFKVGDQGIILEKDGCRAVFLPEVATEQGWTREETLTFLSRKAGLPLDAWKTGATFKVFESCVVTQE